ncbi:MAG: ComF family protein [Ruminococcaceae bacterium]|nr:ComF family protein [Oscillospiraceae bacterium]
MSMGLFRWLGRLLFPPVCRMCNERQSIFAPRLPGVLCPDCMNRWCAELAETCPTCGEIHSQCRCVPMALRQSGCDAFLHLAAYRPQRKTAAGALILRCKDNNDRDVFRFLAKELSDPIMAQGYALEIDVVTFVPRRRAAVQATGHDHAKQLAIALAHELKRPLQSAIRRRILTHQQKQLSAAEREKNAANSFELSPSADVKGKTVLLVDDVCTTGSSLAACAAILKDAGAARVICAVVAKTEHK